jgi:hypothetical protein
LWVLAAGRWFDRLLLATTMSDFVSAALVDASLTHVTLQALAYEAKHSCSTMIAKSQTLECLLSKLVRHFVNFLIFVVLLATFGSNRLVTSLMDDVLKNLSPN